ncbi:hypothetical protein VQ042_25730 [Aurantimonas sp. A2-1-M11]|uniref:hypothetical protein n=1 Tax=Aurantimonas sp. A2-1-M11 TaxID=3113712 RepID=UPI002F94F9CA
MLETTADPTQKFVDLANLDVHRPSVTVLVVGGAGRNGSFVFAKRRGVVEARKLLCPGQSHFRTG